MSAPKITDEAQYQDAISKLDEMWDRGDCGPEFLALEAAVQEYEQSLVESPRLHEVAWPN